MVVAEYQIGQSRIRIHDDCMAKTEKENQEIVDRITGIVSRWHKKQRTNAKEKTA